jgi:hypothetical protein
MVDMYRKGMLDDNDGSTGFLAVKAAAEMEH